MRRRTGASLLEVTIALTLVAVGLLALAAATATLARHRREARLATEAAALGARRAALVAACVPAADGERAVGPLRERWTVRDDAGLRTAVTTVAQAGAERRWTFVARGACAP